MTDEQVTREMITTRNLYNTSTTPAQWEAMILGLGHILMNEDLSELSRSRLEATLFETGYRKMMIDVMRKYKK